MKQFFTKHKSVILMAGLLLAMGTLAIAGTALPWEKKIEAIQTSMGGPVAKSLAILAVVASGGMMAFGEMGGATKKLIQACFGLSMAAVAGTWVPSFFEFGGTAAATMTPPAKVMVVEVVETVKPVMTK